MADSNRATDRVEQLLGRMSLREKVGQLNQRLHGWTGVERRGDGYELTEVFHAELEWMSGLGGLYGVFRSDAWSGRGWHNGIAPEDRPEVAAMVIEAVRAASPHGIGPLLVEEAPHGHQSLGQTLFPANLAAAAAWDPDLTERAAAAMGAELRRAGVHVALISDLDLLRDPRWGRSEECFGEDPRLAADLTAAQVRGLGTAGIGAVLKHFAAQGEGVGGRNGHSAQLGPYDLAELHLPAARAGIAAGAVGVMAAYNDIDGVPCCANADLLTGLLRDEWGFDGVVVGDGLAIDRLAGQTGSLPAAARAALLAGVDLSLWDTAYTLLEDLAADDPALVAAIDRSCRRVLRLKDRFGLLPGSAVREADDAGEAIHPEEAGDQVPGRDAVTLSRRLAARSLVLLDNAGVLPAADPGRVAVLGPNADSATCLLGDYVPPLRAGEARTVRAALGERWSVQDTVAGADLVVCVLGGTSHRAYSEEFADNGAAGGETAATCGEGVDVADLELPGDQAAWVRELRATTDRPVVSVVIMGRPHVLTGVVEHSDATVLAFYPGPHGADAIADLLTGRLEPEGRLPATLPAATGVIPVRHNDRLDATVRYVDRPDPILFPFGFGLGYRSTELLGLRARRAGAAVQVRVTLGNTTGTDLAEVVQVYGRRFGGPRWPRQRELLAFRRVDVPPGALTVDFELPAADVFAAPGGTTMIMVGDRKVEIRDQPE